jgi:hypothetical protein
MMRGHHSRPEFDSDPEIGTGVDGVDFVNDPYGVKEILVSVFVAN